jgi:hypothetical protein
MRIAREPALIYPRYRCFEQCACNTVCGDSDPDGPGTCKGLPRSPREPVVEVVLVPRSLLVGKPSQRRKPGNDTEALHD